MKPNKEEQNAKIVGTAKGLELINLQDIGVVILNQIGTVLSIQELP